MIKKLYKYLKSLDYRLKFLMVGVLNTIIGLGSYWLILMLFGVNILQSSSATTIQIIIATGVSQIAGLINSYFWNKFFTFESKRKSKSETIKFILVYAVVFGIDYLLKFVLHNFESLNEIVIAVIVTLITMIISFIGQKFFVFKNNNQTKSLKN